MDATTVTSSISKMIRPPSQWSGTCYKHRHAWKRAGTMIHQSSNHGSSFGYCKDFSRWPWPSTGSEVLFSRYSFAFSIPRIAGAVYKFPAEQGEWAKRRPPLLFLPRARVLEISPIALKNPAKQASLKLYTTLYDTLILPWTSLKSPVCASVAVPFKMKQSLREIKKTK